MNMNTPNSILDAAMKRAGSVKSEDDVWCDHLRAECAAALAQHLSAAVNISRPIKSLSRLELYGAAEAVTARWIQLVSQRIQDVSERTSKQTEYTNLLMGG